MEIKSPQRSLCTPRGKNERMQAKQGTIGCCCKEKDMKGSPGRDLGSAAHSPSFQPLEPSHSPSFPLLWLLTPPQGPGTWWEGQGRRGERRNLFRETRAPGETSHGLLHSQHPPNLVLAFKGMNDSSGAQHRTSASLCKLLDSHPNERKGTVYGQRGHGSLQTAWEQNSSQTPPVFSTVSNQVLSGFTLPPHRGSLGRRA